MPKTLLAALIAGSLWLTGCELLSNSTLSMPRQSAALTVQPEILAGGYRTHGLVKAYTVEDIDHLLLKLFRLDGASETPVLDGSGKAIAQDIPNDRLDKPITFNSLLPNATYRIRAFAYKAPGESPDNLISTADAHSYTDVTLSNDDRPVTATLKVKLADVLFNGMANASGIVVTPGGFTSNQNVSIHLGPAAQIIQPNSPFWSEHAPAPASGMTWIYESWQAREEETSTATLSFEVLSVNGNEVPYRIAFAIEGRPPQTGESSGELGRYNGFFEPIDHIFVYQGTESVTVPAGTYPEAVKLVERNNIEETAVWIVKDIGMVKEEIRPIDTLIPRYPSGRRLKQFIAP